MNHVPADPRTFSYAIRFPHGQYYLGPKWIGPTIREQRRVEDPSNLGPKHRAYTYTEGRAYEVIRRDPDVFKGCTVERVL